MKVKEQLTQDISIDPVGPIEFLEEFVIRKISPQATEHTRELINSGLLEALNKKQYIPATTVQVNEDGSIIIKQERVKSLLLPFEWSFSMVKDAILHTFDVQSLCYAYGYTLKDFHLWNIVFKGIHPLFVDFGSFKKITESSQAVTDVLQEFLENSYYPLQLWAKGDFYLAHRLLSDEYTRLRFLPVNRLKKPFIIKILQTIEKRKQFLHRKFPQISPFFQWLPNLTPATLKRLIESLQGKPQNSSWMTYHSEHFEDDLIVSSPRFDRINEIIASLAPASLLDIAGNSGAFSLLCARVNTNVEQIICTDYDSNAVESLYQYLKRSKIPRDSVITPMLFNVIFPIYTSLEGLRCEARIKSDLVVALALSHHILLTQGIPIDTFFSKLSRFATKHVLIEFMPLGLFDGVNQSPPVPSWYTEAWFEEHFRKYFTLIHKEQLEENRIMFLGGI